MKANTNIRTFSSKSEYTSPLFSSQRNFLNSRSSTNSRRHSYPKTTYKKEPLLKEVEKLFEKLDRETLLRQELRKIKNRSKMEQQRILRKKRLAEIAQRFKSTQPVSPIQKLDEQLPKLDQVEFSKRYFEFNNHRNADAFHLYSRGRKYSAKNEQDQNDLEISVGKIFDNERLCAFRLMETTRHKSVQHPQQTSPKETNNQ